MQWENLTAPEFEQAVQETKTCILTLGVLERHGDHLPLGTDVFNAHAIACLAATKEPAVVFPPFYFGQIYEAMCFPGTVAIKPNLLLELLLEVLDEIGRNGFEKIILYNGHGGNSHLVNFLTQCTLWKEKPYVVYAYQGVSLEKSKEWKHLCETDTFGHACEWETSITLANYPDLVQMDQIPEDMTMPLERGNHLSGSFTALSWYSKYPEHYVGDAKPSSIEKGKFIRDLVVKDFADLIKRIKEDQVMAELHDEFHHRVSKISNNSDPN